MVAGMKRYVEAEETAWLVGYYRSRQSGSGTIAAARRKAAKALPDDATMEQVNDMLRAVRKVHGTAHATMPYRKICGTCQGEQERMVRFGDDEDADAHTYVCLGCLREAVALLEAP